VFIAGACQGPKDIPDSVAQAGAAAAEAMALADAKYVELEPYTAHVIEDACSGCKTCLTICPYTAIAFVEETKKARVNEVLCKGCGTVPPPVLRVLLSKTCSKIRKFSRKSRAYWPMPNAIESVSGNGQVSTEVAEPRIVGFFCTWCTYLAADLAELPVSSTPQRARHPGHVFGAH